MFRRRRQKKIFLCFYCNTPSTIQIDRTVPLRKWYCAECEQTNHLDEKGEIADYFPSMNTSPTLPIRTSSPISSPGSPAPPFCDTCISNQTLLIKNLATFLPPEDHPDYDTYAAALPAHKAELEVKYPQVCVDCEERVRARLQRNNYLAKTSALGGFLKKRRREEGLRVNWDGFMWFRVVVWWVRGLFWWVTSIGFVAWCGLAFIRPESIGATYKTPFFGQNEPFRVILPRFIDKLSTTSLPRWTSTIPRYVALISPFIVMWDYKWLTIQQIPGSQVEGLREYREIQVIVLLIRFLAWGMTKWIQDAVFTMWISAFLGIISLMALAWSLGTLKVKFPPEIALQDSSDDFTPQSSPTPPPQRIIFQRTQNPPPSFPQLKPQQRQDPIDLNSLGISDRPTPLFKDDSTMDWIPSRQKNTFSSLNSTGSYSRDSSIFANARGTLPPAPGTAFTSSALKEKSINRFKSINEDSSDDEAPSQKRDIQFREQRFFPPQESTGLESLLGQALTLDDEPTLVRAVKAVKRTMAQDKHIREAYINAVISIIPNVLLLALWGLNRTQEGVSFAFTILGIGGLVTSRWRLGQIFVGITQVVIGGLLGLPISGLLIPYHPILLRLYSPDIQRISHHLAIATLTVILSRDIVKIISLKGEQWEKLRKEEIKRQEKMRGIFYTPGKSKSVNGRTTGKGMERDFQQGGRSKSRSIFALT